MVALGVLSKVNGTLNLVTKNDTKHLKSEIQINEDFKKLQLQNEMLKKGLDFFADMQLKTNQMKIDSGLLNEDEIAVLQENNKLIESAKTQT
jgi:outer membrane lipopolysaccharide assembly protein LptE/RlpB